MNIKILKDKRSCLILAVLCFVMYALVFMTKDMFSSAMASIVEDGVMTKSQTGAISAMFWLVYAFCQIAGGFAADRYSPSVLICIGLIGNALANIVIFFNHSYVVIMIAWMFAAAAQFGVWPATFKIISTQIDLNYRHNALYLIMFAASLGSMISKLVAAIVPYWKYNFLVSFLILVILLVFWLIVYGYLKTKMVIVTDDSLIKKQSKLENKESDLAKKIIATGFICIIAIGVFRNTVGRAIAMLTPTILMESYTQLSASTATILSIIMVLFSMIGLLMFRFIQMKITKNEIIAIMGLFVCCIPLLFLSSFVGNLHYMYVLISLSVCSLFFNIAGSFSDYIPMRYVSFGKSGTVAGVLNCAAGLGNVFASYVFAYMAEFLPWRIVIFAWIVLLMVGIVLCLSIIKRWNSFIGIK